MRPERTRPRRRGLGALLLACVLAAPLTARAGDAAGGVGGFLQDFLQGLNRGMAEGVGPVLTSVSPARIPEGRPVTLEFRGSGLDAGTVAVIQVRDPATGGLTWRDFPLQGADGTTARLVLDRGFSADPPVRRVYLRNAAGRRSAEQGITVVRGGEAPAPAAVPSAAPAGAGGPRLRALEPASVRAAVPFTLAVVGSGLGPGCSVFVEVNTRAADPQAEPVYDFVRFAPQSAARDRLEVTFDRGFGAAPPERRIYVEDAQGRRSNTLVLTIEPQGGDRP